MLSDGRRPLRSGVRRVVTVLFADLCGFTRLSDRLPPEAVVAMLDEFFEAMTSAAVAHGAGVDKLIGDAIMLTFGLTVPKGDDTVRALRCAAAMHHAFAALPPRWRRRYGPLRVGLAIGCAQGEAVLANVGSAVRMDYTVIGTPVNLASRLTAAAGAGRTLATAEVCTAAAAAPSMLRFGPLRRLTLKGFRAPIGARTVRAARPRTVAGASAPVTDPVCGMKLPRTAALRMTHAGRSFFFCSPHCRRTFRRDLSASEGAR